MTTTFGITGIALASFGLMVATFEARAGSLPLAALDGASTRIEIIEPAQVARRRGVGVGRVGVGRVGVGRVGVVGRPVARGAARRAVRRCAVGMTC
jgi:hypothetical protein